MYVIKKNILPVLAFLGCFHAAFAQVKISINCSSTPMRSVLKEIEMQTGKNFIYNDYLIDNVIVDFKISNVMTEDALTKLYSHTDLAFKLFGTDNIVIYKKELQKPNNISTITINDKVIENDSTSSSNIVAPSINSITKPVYPPDAVYNHFEGNVTVKVLVSKNGKPYKTHIVKSSGYALIDSSAVEYLRNINYKPAHIKDQPVNIWMLVSFNYKILN